MPDLGSILSPSRIGERDPEVEQNMTRRQFYAASNQISFESDGQFGRKRFGVLCQNRETPPEPPLPRSIAMLSTTSHVPDVSLEG